MLVKNFNDVRTLPLGVEDPAVKKLHDRVKKTCQKAAIDEDWWAVQKLASALTKGEFSEPVCILCNRFCYVTSFDYDACPKTPEAIQFLEGTDLSPEEAVALYGPEFGTSTTS